MKTGILLWICIIIMWAVTYLFVEIFNIRMSYFYAGAIAAFIHDRIEW